jgi:hypothetical protein
MAGSVAQVRADCLRSTSEIGCAAWRKSLWGHIGRDGGVWRRRLLSTDVGGNGKEREGSSRQGQHDGDENSPGVRHAPGRVHTSNCSPTARQRLLAADGLAGSCGAEERRHSVGRSAQGLSEVRVLIGRFANSSASAAHEMNMRGRRA